MAGPRTSDDCEAVVVGAGPYGLAAAAHLRGAGVGVRVFGRPLSFWQEHMPDGMRLRSPWGATHIADPAHCLSLDDFAKEAALRPQDQLPIERFRQYGDWFQRQAVPDLDARMVVRLERIASAFRLTLDDQSVVTTHRVAMALGLAHQEQRPSQFAGLPAALVSHTSEHKRLDKWAGKRVGVVGRGQSACESAALLREAGSEVDLICQGDIRFIGRMPGADGARGWSFAMRELLQAPSAVGPFPLNWLNELPGFERRLPRRLRLAIAGRSMRAACASWVAPRLAGVKVISGRAIKSVREQGGRLVVMFDDSARGYDHVLLGTGYRIDIGKLGVLSPDLIANIACRDGAPILAAGCESNVPGLHFVGASAVDSFGPLMRFIAGTGWAARALTSKAVSDRRWTARRARNVQAQLATRELDLGIPAE